MTNPFSKLLRRSHERRVYNDMLHFDDFLLLDMGLTRGDLSDLIAGRKSPRRDR